VSIRIHAELGKDTKPPEFWPHVAEIWSVRLGGGAVHVYTTNWCGARFAIYFKQLAERNRNALTSSLMQSHNLKRALAGGLGVLLGGVFLWLALRQTDPQELKSALHEMNGYWLIIAVAVYLLSIGVRCLRWGVLLRATDNVKWRHGLKHW
jgi:hypothetical protein